MTETETIVLKDLGIVRGILSEINKWSVRLILIKIGSLSVILPEELELKQHLGQKIGILRDRDKYRVWRLEKTTAGHQ